MFTFWPLTRKKEKRLIVKHKKNNKPSGDNFILMMNSKDLFMTLNISLLGQSTTTFKICRATSSFKNCCVKRLSRVVDGQESSVTPLKLISHSINNANNVKRSPTAP